MTLLYMGDSRVNRNVGARGTSIALRNILGQTVNSIIPFFQWYKPFVGAGPDIDKDEALLMEQYPEDYARLVENIKRCDIVSINGEGIFLFTAPVRSDLGFFLVAMHLCRRYNKPYVIINTGISPPADSSGHGLCFGAPDPAVLETVLAYLSTASLVTVRDPLSVPFVKKYNTSIDIRYVPDALFSMYDFYEQNSPLFDNLLSTPQFTVGHNRAENFLPTYNFEKNYVLLSGSAFAARYGGDQKADRFAELALALQAMLREYDTELYLFESCDGDSFLKLDVSEQTGIPCIPTATNIFLLGRILGKCRCLISGRYHPSMFAAMGGAPLVLMGSDSHKIAALPDILKLEGAARNVYPSVPAGGQIEDIVSRTRAVMESPRNQEAVRQTCRENGEDAKKLAALVKAAL